MAEHTGCISAAAALRSMSSNVSIGIFEGSDVAFTRRTELSSEDLGTVDASVSVLQEDLLIHPTRSRVQPGGEVRFRISARVRQKNLYTVATFEGIARVILARTELACGCGNTNLAYTPVISIDGDPCGIFVDLVVPVPANATPGSLVVLRRVILAGCDVALDDAPIQVNVGFVHEPGPEGRVFAAAGAGDIPALKQALDDGCSTQELNEASCARVFVSESVSGCERVFGLCVLYHVN
jgi:hypothetical protein